MIDRNNKGQFIKGHKHLGGHKWKKGETAKEKNPNWKGGVWKNTKKYYNNAAKSYYRKRRRLIIEHYGKNNGCACCGEKIYEFLGVDHINGGGKKHRKELARSGTNLYSWLIKNNFPKEFQILCHNCNMAEGLYKKVCPHKRLNS